MLGCPDVVLTQALCALVLPDAICMPPLWIRLSPSACKSCSEQRSMHSHLSSISQGEPWVALRSFKCASYNNADSNIVYTSTHLCVPLVQLKQDCGLTIAQYGLLSG